MVSLIATDHTFQQCAHRVDRLMHPLTQLRLDGLKRRPHPLGHSPTAYNEMPFGVNRTVMREPKKRERLRFSLTTLLPIDLREPTETRSVASSPDGVLTQSAPAVSETPSGTVRRLHAAQSRPPDHQRSGQSPTLRSPPSGAMPQPTGRTHSADTRSPKAVR